MTGTRPETERDWKKVVNKRLGLLERRGRGTGGSRPVAVPTSGRPLVADVLTGTEIFDTTLGRPLWSNGSTWVDAMGNAV